MTLMIQSWCPGDHCDPCTRCSYVPNADPPTTFSVFNWAVNPISFDGVFGGPGNTEYVGGTWHYHIPQTGTGLCPSCNVQIWLPSWPGTSFGPYGNAYFYSGLDVFADSQGDWPSSVNLTISGAISFSGICPHGGQGHYNYCFPDGFTKTNPPDTNFPGDGSAGPWYICGNLGDYTKGIPSAGIDFSISIAASEGAWFASGGVSGGFRVYLNTKAIG